MRKNIYYSRFTVVHDIALACVSPRLTCHAAAGAFCVASNGQS